MSKVSSFGKGMGSVRLAWEVSNLKIVKTLPQGHRRPLEALAHP